MKENITEVVTQFSGKQINQYRIQLLEHGLTILGQPNLKEILKEDHAEEVYQAGVNPVSCSSMIMRKIFLLFVKDNGFPALIGGNW